MSLEVIGAGFGRTGTKSLKLALEQLGYDKCHHMMEVMPNRAQIDYWDRASRGESMNWEEVFTGYKAAVDWPSSAYYEELAEYFPDAKVVLSVRDPEAWYKSTSETIYLIGSAIPGWIAGIYPPIKTLKQFVFRTIWDGIFDGRFEEKEYALQVFRDNIETAKRVIPPDRLLIHEAKEGWPPLCEFLGKPVPDTPYPRVNEAKDIKRMLVVLRWLNRLPWILVALLGLGLAFWLLQA